MAEFPDELRRLIGKKTDDVAKAIDALVAQLDVAPEEEDFAREQAQRVFNVLTDAYIDAHARVQRARAAVVIAFATLKVCAKRPEQEAPARAIANRTDYAAFRRWR